MCVLSKTVSREALGLIWRHKTCWLPEHKWLNWYLITWNFLKCFWSCIKESPFPFQIKSQDRDMRQSRPVPMYFGEDWKTECTVSSWRTICTHENCCVFWFHRAYMLETFQMLNYPVDQVLLIQRHIFSSWSKIYIHCCNVRVCVEMPNIRSVGGGDSEAWC